MNDRSAIYSYRLVGDFLLFLLLCLSSLRYYFGISFVELKSDYTGFWFPNVYILDFSGGPHGWDIFRRLTRPEKHLINRWQTVMKIDQHPGFILICVVDYRSLLRQLNSRKCTKNWLRCEMQNEGEALVSSSRLVCSYDTYFTPHMGSIGNIIFRLVVIRFWI